MKKKKPENKNQEWEPIQQKYKANKKTNRYNPKEKTKANNQQRPYAHRETHGYEMTINNNKRNP